MKKQIYFLLLSCIFINGYSQRENFKIKEQYEYVHNNYLTNPCTYSEDPFLISNYFGDGESYILESYIKMYETTKDKAYLIKFIIKAICTHEHRRDVVGIDSDPTWASKTGCNGASCLYHDGLLLWPMTHFVYLIETQEPSLISLQLPPGILPYNKFGKYGSDQWGTYGEFAEWLRIRSQFTLNYYLYGANTYWANDTKCLVPSTDLSDRAQQINLQAGFGSALFYLGLNNPDLDYLHKAASIAIAYKGKREVSTPNSLGYCPIFENIHLEDVMESQSNGSLIFRTYGWRKETCLDNIEGTIDDYEDITHAVQTLNFPRAIVNKLESGGTMLITDLEMIGFRNTFTKNIFAFYSAGCPNFHSGIDGDDHISYNTSLGGLNTNALSSLAWMPFYKYDEYGSTPNVYDLVMEYYRCIIKDNPSLITGNLVYNGLAEVVAAQWDKECVNLSLYNRHVVYDQDFWVKNNLTIEPLADSSSSFAEPIITTQEFVIDSGIKSNFTCQENLIFKAGFKASHGSKFKAFITPGLCTNGFRVSNNNSTSNSDSNLVIKNAFKSNSELNVSILPNPTSSAFSVNISKINDNENYTICIYDMKGQLLKIIEHVQEVTEINMQNFSKGIYTLHIKSSNGNSQVKKISLIE